MAVYELIFVLDDVGELGDPRVDAAEADLDIVFERHGALCLATITVDGSNAYLAAIDGSHRLKKAGFTVLRSYPDLVTRTEIAERLGCTRQAVGNWVRGERHSAVSFPTPTNLAAGGLWLWGDVVAWLRATNSATVESDLSYPTIADHAWIDANIDGLGQRHSYPKNVVTQYKYTFAFGRLSGYESPCCAPSPAATSQSRYRELVST